MVKLVKLTHNGALIRSVVFSRYAHGAQVTHRVNADGAGFTVTVRKEGQRAEPLIYTDDEKVAADAFQRLTGMSLADFDTMHSWQVPSRQVPR